MQFQRNRVDKKAYVCTLDMIKINFMCEYVDVVDVNFVVKAFIKVYLSDWLFWETATLNHINILPL